MKKWLSALLLLCLLLPLAGAETQFFYTTESVTTCENTSSLYNKFYESGELSVNIPGCAQDLVPQGISYLADEGWMIIAGYSSGTTPSAIVAVDMETNQVVKEIFLQNVDGSAYTGHAGGVAVTEKNIFISNNNHLYRLSLDSFRAAEASATLKFDEAIPVPSRASYCQYNDGILWVGEFEYGGEYKTDNSHRIKTADGYQRAWAIGYQLTSETDNELKADCITAEGAIPDVILSTTERIQGLTVKEGMIYLSQSYGRKNSSTIYRHVNVLEREANAEVDVLGVKRPIWFLDKKSLDAAIIAPPMTECLCTVDGAIYVLFESGAEKYRDSKNPMDRVFKLTGF
ncbi:MAG: hypothetical protein IKW00_02030 [Clostridia bacterium]|nr:hypothetical protein [Clostridia bacterium]